jgi:hypothetical protein
MAGITNPEVVAFCNQRVREAADRLAQTYFLAKAVTAEWFANNLSTAIAYDNGDLVVDGSAIDGRHPISGIDVNNLITRLMELTADYEASSNAKLNTILAVAVNPER